MTDLLLGHIPAGPMVTRRNEDGQIVAVRERQEVRIPLDIVTQPVGIVSRRGMGKTYTASVLAEEMLEHGAQVVIIDPLSVWHGLRTGADGVSKGYEVVLFGDPDEDADLPLTEMMGERIAELVVKERFSCILSLTHLSKTKMRIFVTDFMERLYDLRANRPIHLIVDEADLFGPQRSPARQGDFDPERMLGAFNDIVRRGRSRGLGCTMITQRPAVISKDILTQIEVLIALQVPSPQDRKALMEWVEAKDNDGQAEKFMSSIAGLQRGQAWIWSPSEFNIFTRVDIRKRRTYDSSSTPKVGSIREKIKTVARPDLEALRTALSGVIHEADDNNPQLLRSRIAVLENRIEQMQAEKVDALTVRQVAIKERDQEWTGWAMGFEEALQQLHRVFAARVLPIASSDQATVEVDITPSSPWDPPPERIDDLDSLADEDFAVAQKYARIEAVDHQHGFEKRFSSFHQAESQSSAANAFRLGPVDGLIKGERAVLAVLVQCGGQASWSKTSILAGYSPGSSNMRNVASLLRGKGYAEGTMAGGWKITPEGRAAIGQVEPLPRGEALRQYWLNKVGGKAPRLVLKALMDAWPRELTKDQIEAKTGISAGSSNLRNAFSILNVMGLITGRGEVRRASDDLFGDRR